jgi:hypothetical protein
MILRIQLSALPTSRLIYSLLICAEKSPCFTLCIGSTADSTAGTEFQGHSENNAVSFWKN